MTATITIHMDNAAFEDDPATELACILRGAAAGVERQGVPDGLKLSLRDTNGNAVGHLEVTP